MNKKIPSLIVGLLFITSIFNIINITEVSGATLGVVITSNTSTTSFFNSGSMPMRFTVTFNVSGTPTAAWTALSITAPAGYVLASKAVQPAPSNFTIDYATSTADGANSPRLMAYTCNITSAGTYSIPLDIVQCTAAVGPHTWTITETCADPGIVGPYNPVTTVDNIAPVFLVRYNKTPKVDFNTSPDLLGTGTVTIRIEANESISINTSQLPIVQVKQHNQASWSTVSVTSLSGNYPDSVFTGTYSISSSGGVYDGIAQVTVSAKDRAGNTGTNVNVSRWNPLTTPGTGSDGPNFIVDSQCNQPALVSPLNGFSSTSGDITFIWQKITDPANKNITYTIQYSTSSTFSSNVITASGVYDENSSTLVSGAGFSLSVNERSYSANSLSQGTWYWRVYATDALGNQSNYSETRSLSVTSSDLTPPSFTVRYIKTPKIDYNKTPDVMGSGTLQIKIYCSEILQAPPTVQIKPHNQTSWTSASVTPSGQNSVYTATYTVPSNTYNNGLAQITVEGKDVVGNIGNSIRSSRWSDLRTSPSYLPREEDSDGNTFYIDTATDSPSLYQPSNGHVLPSNINEANYTFYKISDISAERPADLGQNNCITYHIQYSTTSSFTSNVITESVDINEIAAAGNEANFCTPTPVPGLKEYNKWYIDWTTKPPAIGFYSLRMHTSQALSNGTWYWRAWATDKLGNQSPYSETRSFSVSTVAPNLYAPADLSLLKVNNPLLQWYKVPQATYYNLRLSRGDTDFLDYTLYPNKIAVNSFSNDANGSSSLDPFYKNIMDYNVSISTPPTPAIGRLEDGVWYWKVASNLDTASYSEIWRFTVDSTGPPGPVLGAPYNGEVSQNKRPTFNWSAVSDVNDLSNPVRYYIQISARPLFPGNLNYTNSSSLYIQSGATWISTIWSSTYSSSIGKWYENNATYQAGPLTVTNFNLINDLPETDTNAAFYWRVYAVDSSNNKGPNSNVHILKIDTVPPLVWGDKPAGDNADCEDWPSKCETVTVSDRDKISLALRAPSNGLILSSKNPVVEWQHSSCPCVRNNISSYIVQYSTDITFPPSKTTDSVGIFQVTGVSYDANLTTMAYTIQNPLFNGTYFWRVCAVDTAGNRTQFTAPWSFTVNVPGNESQPQCSSTVPCPTGFTCQNGACVAVSYSPGNLTLTVQNAAGTAISGATVTVDGVAQTTSAAGQVTYTTLSGGSHTINNITASGYVDYGTSTVLVNGNTTQTITMTVPGTEGYIWGTIYFDAVGTAAPNVLIDIYNQSTDVKVDSRLTNSEGKFQSSPLPSTGTYYAKIPAYEKELRDLQPTSLTTGEKIVILETKGTVTGIVQDDTGQIVSAATVVLKKYPGEVFVDTKTTNTIGQFSFDALPGTYVVTISKAGYDAYTSSSFSVQSKQTVNLQSVLGSIVLNSIKGSLTVSVKDDKGATINTATVTIRSSAGAVVKSITTSGGSGSTQLSPGAYRVSAVSSGYAESLQQTTNITSNQTSSISISLAPATGTIRVVAKDASGVALSGASVYVDGSLSGITDSNGELLVTGLKLGTHTVRITKGGYTTVEEQVTSGDSTVVVDTALPKNNLLLYLGVGLGLLILAGAVYFLKFANKGGPKRPPMSGGPALPGRPGAPKLRPHRHKGGLPPSSIRVKKKNL